MGARELEKGVEGWIPLERPRGHQEGRACELQDGKHAADKLASNWPDLPGCAHAPRAVKSLMCELFGGEGEESGEGGGKRGECGPGQV